MRVPISTACRTFRQRPNRTADPRQIVDRHANGRIAHEAVAVARQLGDRLGIRLVALPEVEEAGLRRQFDRSDTVISHPFFSACRFLEYVESGGGSAKRTGGRRLPTPVRHERLRDAYLDVWAEYASRDRLRGLPPGPAAEPTLPRNPLAPGATLLRGRFTVVA